jgi:membrane protease YdiL (CAAX protease family)
MGDRIAAAGSADRKTAIWLALAFAMLFPTVAAWSYFVAMAGTGTAVSFAQQSAYVVGKVVQFAFPVLFLALGGGPWPRPLLPRRTGLGLGLAFGLFVAGLMLAVYFLLLRHSPLLAQTPAQVRHKLEQVDMATPARYLVLGAFIIVPHSLLEEYYWRWFVFGQLRRVVPRGLALVLSALAFMAHHVVVLYVYLPGGLLTTVVPFSLGIAVGGVVWAWLYDRTGTLYPSWLGHVLVDTAIFVIGWDLLWPVGAHVAASL